MSWSWSSRQSRRRRRRRLLHRLRPRRHSRTTPPIRAVSGLTYTQFALDALNGTHTVLVDLVAKATEPAARPAGSLFSGPFSAPAALNPKVQITLRPRSSDAAVIDKLATDLGSGRSLLVSLALQAHLPRA